MGQAVRFGSGRARRGAQRAVEGGGQSVAGAGRVTCVFEVGVVGWGIECVRAEVEGAAEGAGGGGVARRGGFVEGEGGFSGRKG